MPVQRTLRQLAEDSYVSLFKKYFTELKKNERAAQKAAITKSFSDLIATSGCAPNEAWSAIYAAHVKRRTGRTLDLNENEITQVISAHQSWIKSSGHAAEDFWKNEANKALSKTNINIYLQRDVSNLLTQGKISNSGTQLSILTDWLASSSFDLYASCSENNSNLIFGCIQSKTSIRDRVTREREPSNQAMDNGFWSVALVIDGDFLRLDKFEKMVNGGSEIYPRCGWHQMYVMSVAAEKGRILRLNSDFSNFAEDAISASKHFVHDNGILFSTSYPFIK